MKKNTTLSLLLILALALPVPMHADSNNFPKTPEGVHLKKSVTQSADNDRLYTITLESYVTGTTVVTESKETIPCDIVLVLDNSASMSTNVTTYTYNKSTQTTLTYTQAGNPTYYFKDGTEYYQVKRDRTGRNSTSYRYHLYYTKNGNNLYFLPDGSIIGNRGDGVTRDNTPIFNGQGELYTATTTTITRRKALQNAAAAFIQSVYDNSPDKDGTDSTIPADKKYHNIAIVYYGKSAQAGVGALKDTGLHPLDESLTNSLVTNFADGSEMPASENGTYCDLGLGQAYTTLYAARTDGRNKVTVFFTDGEPGGMTGRFEDERARASITQSNLLKSDDLSNTIGSNTFPSRVYAVGLMTSGTSDNHYNTGTTGPLSSHDNDKYRYMHYTSSNYDVSGKDFSTYRFNTDFTDLTCQGELDGGNACAGHGSEEPHGYFTKSDGSNLEQIFASIASASSQPSSSYDLKETSMIVLDVMSSYFRLPEGTDPDDIKVYKSKYNGVNGNDTIWGTPTPLKVKHAEDETYDVEVVVDGKEVSVTGFDFAANFVGKHPESEGSSVLVDGGYKLIFEVKIEVDPDNVGGATLYTNDARSGIYVANPADPTKPTPIAGFERPTVSLPNIIIRAYGLEPGESASYTIYKIFTEKDVITAKGDYSYKEYYDAILDENFTPIHIIITQEEGKTNASAKVKLNDEGRYKVVEDSWAYTYDLKVGGKNYYSKDVDSHRWTVSGNDTTFLKTTWPDGGTDPVVGTTIIRTVCLGTQAKANNDPSWANNPFHGDGTLFDFIHTKTTNVPATHIGEAAKRNWYEGPTKEGGTNDDDNNGEEEEEETPKETGEE